MRSWEQRGGSSVDVAAASAAEAVAPAGVGHRVAGRLGVELARALVEGLGQGELRALIRELPQPEAPSTRALGRAARALGRGGRREGVRPKHPGERPRHPSERERRVSPAPVRRRGASERSAPAARPAPGREARAPEAGPFEQAEEVPAAVEVAPAPPGPGVASPLARDPHEVAAAWLGRDTRYVSGALAPDWRRGRFDCTGFLLHVLAESGVDVDEPVPGASGGALARTAADEGPSTYDLVHMTEEVLPELGQAREAAGDAEVEAILRRHGVPRRGAITDRVERLPEGPDKRRARALRRRAEAARARRLRELVEAEDPRVMGVVNAMGAGGFGRRVDLAEVRPGDMVQTWTFTSSGVVGHAALAHTVRCRADVRDAGGAVARGAEIVLDGRTDPASVLVVHEVRSVELLGAHPAGVDAAGRSRGGGVYVRPPARLEPGGSGFDRVYVGRPGRSRWDEGRA